MIFIVQLPTSLLFDKSNPIDRRVLSSPIHRALLPRGIWMEIDQGHRKTDVPDIQLRVLDHSPIFSPCRASMARAFIPIQATLKTHLVYQHSSPTKTLKQVPQGTFTTLSSPNLRPSTCPLASLSPTSLPSSPHTTNPQPVSAPHSTLLPQASTPIRINSCL